MIGSNVQCVKPKSAGSLVASDGDLKERVTPVQVVSVALMELSVIQNAIIVIERLK